jgi:FtsH-binding integral membrane protein
MIFNFGFNQMILSGLGVLIFSGYVLYDTSNLLHRYESDQFVAATIALYLDILNLFLFILRILGGSSRR